MESEESKLIEQAKKELQEENEYQFKQRAKELLKQLAYAQQSVINAQKALSELKLAK